MSNVFIYNESDLLALSLILSSKGNQRKWYCEDTKEFIKGPFEYQGKLWQDWKVEVFATRLSDQMKLTVDVMRQSHCQVKGEMLFDGVVSNDFRTEGHKFVSFNRILMIMNQEFLQNLFMDRKIEFVQSVIMKHCGIDIYEYLISMILLDVLIGNEDRHLNNFGVFLREGVWSTAMLFDFGLGLFEHDKRYSNSTLFQAIDHMMCKPFNSNPIANLNWLKNNEINYVKKILPEKFIFEADDFPNQLGREYFEFICRELEVEIEYV